MISKLELEELKSSLNDDTIIVAVSKNHSLEKIRIANSLGLTHFGENRLQELKSKYVDDFNWHFIGHIQTNKIKEIVKYASLIQSVDRENVLNTINKVASKINKIQDILIQVNVLNEEGKSGISLDKLDELINLALRLDNIKLKGLMVIGPTDQDINKTRLVFKKMKELFDYYKDKCDDFKYLSMGMSDDYLEAIKYGSNMIRIGTKIFGNRY